jgi:hypothetical protein
LRAYLLVDLFSLLLFLARGKKSDKQKTPSPSNLTNFFLSFLLTTSLSLKEL